MKNLIMTLFVMALAVPSFAETKVGYIDMQNAIQTTKAGKKAKKELEAEFNKRKKQLQKKEGELKKLGEELEKKALVLSDKAKAEKQREFQTKMLEFQKNVQQNQQEIQKREQDLTSPIVKKLQKAVAAVAKKEGYSLVLEKRADSVVWSDQSVDLTDKVIKEFEK